VSAKSVALIPQCAECGTIWLPADGKRWEAYLTCDEPAEGVFYCPECGERGSATTEAGGALAEALVLGRRGDWYTGSLSEPPQPLRQPELVLDRIETEEQFLPHLLVRRDLVAR
jgi:hypothetical protein